MPKTKMTEAHKQALAEGRRLAADVNAYLNALEAHKPRRGRKKSPEGIRKKLATIESELKDANGIQKVQLAQDRIDLENELEQLEQRSDLEESKQRFIKSAKKYSQSKGITYAAWREVGVPADVLRQAGINRGFDPSA